MSTYRRRVPDEVRAAAVRALLFLSCTLMALTLAVLASYAHRNSLLVPALAAVALGVFGTVWCVLELLISRQITSQRR